MLATAATSDVALLAAQKAGDVVTTSTAPSPSRSSEERANATNARFTRSAAPTRYSTTWKSKRHKARGRLSL
jgi:hypothetical protein